MAETERFRVLRVPDLPNVNRAKIGVVLVDHYERDSQKQSVLHGAGCKWLRSVGPSARLRHSENTSDAYRWLQRNRGDEGDWWKRCSVCSAVGRKVSPPKQRPYPIGQPVAIEGLRPTAARVVAQDDDKVQCRFFTGAGEAERSVIVPRRRLRTLSVGPADCVWLDDDGELRRSAVFQADGDYAVVLDRGRLREVPVTDILLRDFSPVSDPLLHLANGFAGDVKLTQVRRRFAERYLALGAPAEGLTAVLSAPVELFPHQLGVVRQVLRDPVQRYLLADEVGLGKTIEAGLIIRQRLIDAPRSVVVCLVPESLVPQWEDELAERLGLNRFRPAGIEVRAHEDDSAWLRATIPDLIVIDEAHRIAAGWTSPLADQRERYGRAKALTTSAARVLLLSATPVLNREQDLLGMLHLLDPDAFPIDDLAGFKRRVEDREELGSLLAQLAPDAPLFLLEHPLKVLRTQHADDLALHSLLDAVHTATPGAQAAAVLDVRGYLSETYRLHSRMIRNRRSVVTASTFSVRGRRGVASFDDRDPRSLQISRWLERFRGVLLDQAADGDAALRPAHAEVFWAFVQASSGDLECLRHLVLYRRTRRTHHMQAAGLDLAGRDALKGISLGESAVAALDELLGILGPEPENQEALEARYLLAHACHQAIAGRRAVVFTSSSASASALAIALHVFDDAAVALIGAESSTERRREVVVNFNRGTLDVVVCDASSEEGLNLQVADLIVFADVPRFATRIEQRIGRADRHGGNIDPVTTLTLDRPSNRYVSAWLATLARAFRIFDASTASSLFAVEAVEQRQRVEWFEDGVPDLDEDAMQSVAARLAIEQTKINRVDALDAIVREDLGDEIVVERIHAAERVGAAAFADAFVEVAAALRRDLKISVERDAGSLTCRIGQRSNAMFDRDAVIDVDLKSAVVRAKVQDAAATGLVRPGDPMVEALKQHADWDDRFQTFAAWGNAPDGVPGMAICTSFIVAADPTSAVDAWQDIESGRLEHDTVRTDADAPLAIAALRRRVDAVLPPTAVTLWFAADGEVIHDEEQIRQYEALLASGGLEQRWSRNEAFEAATVARVASVDDVLRRVRAHAPRVAIEASGVEKSFVAAISEAREQWSARVRTLRTRAERLNDAAGVRTANAEERLTYSLIAALEHPVAVWDSAGLIVLRGSE